MGVLLLVALLRIWPECPADGWLSSDFGRRQHPVTGRWRMHAGIDVANVRGTEIRAPWPGRIVKIRRSRSAGLYVVMRAGKLRLMFAHLDETSVKAGQHVEAGDQIGRMGRSGRATGPHLHLEVRRGWKAVDPSFALAGCPWASEGV